MQRTRLLLAATLIAFAAACAPRPGPPPPELHAHEFLVCTRRHESDRSDRNGNGLHDAGYRAYNPAGPYLGAYQFLQSTWDSTAAHAGWDGLIGVDPRDASVEEQDMMAWHLYEWQGSRPWGGRCG